MPEAAIPNQMTQEVLSNMPDYDVRYRISIKPGGPGTDTRKTNYGGMPVQGWIYAINARFDRILEFEPSIFVHSSVAEFKDLDFAEQEVILNGFAEQILKDSSASMTGPWSRSYNPANEAPWDPGGLGGSRLLRFEDLVTTQGTQIFGSGDDEITIEYHIEVDLSPK